VLRWHRDASGPVLRVSLGTLTPGGTLDTITCRLSALGRPGSPLLLGGRRAGEAHMQGSPLTLSTGLFCHVAAFDYVLKDEGVDHLYESAKHGLR
jgi:hypothetical protein